MFDVQEKLVRCPPPIPFVLTYVVALKKLSDTCFSNFPKSTFLGRKLPSKIMVLNTI